MQHNPPLVTPNWKSQYRIISSHFPPINFFENIVEPSQMEEAFYIESLTNERLLEEAGELSLVRAGDRVCGKGSSIVMAAFTHIGRASRFTDGSYGVYYCTRDLKTSIYETIYHREKFLASTEEEPGHISMRVYVGKILKPLHDIRDEVFKTAHDPDNYIHSQLLAKTLRNQDSWGILYNSVRHEGGECVAALRPPAVSIPVQSKHLAYIWNGDRITSVYEKSGLIVEL